MTSKWAITVKPRKFKMKFCNFPKNLKLVTAMYCSSSCSMYVFIVIVVIVVFTSKWARYWSIKARPRKFKMTAVCLYI